jgi:hypothetical protein
MMVRLAQATPKHSATICDPAKVATKGPSDKVEYSTASAAAKILEDLLLTGMQNEKCRSR